MSRNVDTYDGHLLRTEWDGDTLVHDVVHPSHCHKVERYAGWWEHDCAVSFASDGAWDECWQDATSPGVRVIGWRHDYRPGGPWGGPEHDVVAWCLADKC